MSSVSAAFCNDQANGNWNATATWSCGVVPGEDDVVTIDSHTVTLTANAEVDDITIGGGTLDMDSYRLDVHGNWTKSSGTFTPGTGTVHMVGSGGTITSGGSAFNNLTLNDGLVGYWKLDETSGTTAADSSGYGNDGTHTNSPTISETVAPTRFTNGRSLEFDGSNDYVDGGSDSILDITDELTMSAWVNPDAFVQFGPAVWRLKTTSPFTWAQYRLGYGNSANEWGVTFNDTGGTWRDHWAGSLSTDTWTHIVGVVKSNDYVKIYADGVLIQEWTGLSYGLPSGTGPVNIGRQQENNSYFDGNIDDVRIYNRALSQYEISALAAGNQPATSWETSGLVGYWPFEEGSGTSTADKSGNGNNGTLTNMDGSDWDSSTKADLDFTNGYSLDFDGSDDYITVANDATLRLAGDLTIGAWVQFDDSSKSNAIVAFGNPNNADEYWFSLNSNSVKLQTNNVDYWQYAFTPSTSTWYHMLWKRSGSTNSLYIDGDEKATATYSTGFTDTSVALEIGGTASSGNDIDGRMDDVRIYNRALSDWEIQQLVDGLRPGTWKLGDALDVDGDLTLNSGYLSNDIDNDRAITVGGNWDNNGGLFNADGGTVTFDGTSGSHEIQSGGQSFEAVTVSGNGGTWWLHDALEVDGAYVQSNGTVNVNTNSWPLISEDFDQTGGTFTPQTGTIVLDGTASATITFTSAINDLEIADPTEDGLVGYWSFDEGQGVTAYDLSGNGNHGTLTNGALWSSSTGSTAFTNLGSIEFDGSDDYIETGDITELNSAGAFTIAGWFTQDTLDQTRNM